jgi:hypothetical protein
MVDEGSEAPAPEPEPEVEAAPEAAPEAEAEVEAEAAPPDAEPAPEAEAEAEQGREPDYDALANLAQEIQGPKQRRQMVMLAQTNDQLKKIVEYSHDLVGDVVAKLKDDLVRPYFFEWKRVMAEELRAGRLFRKAQKLNARMRLRQCVGLWKGKMELHWACDAKTTSLDTSDRKWVGAAKFLNRRMSKHGVGGWKEVVEENKRRLRMIEKVTKKLIGVRVAAALSGWRDKHVHDKQNRVKLQRAAAKLKNRHTATALGAWTLMVSELKRHAHILKGAIARMTKQAQLAGFIGFHHNWSTQRRRKTILKRCRAKMENGQLSAAFAGARGTWHPMRGPSVV